MSLDVPASCVQPYASAWVSAYAAFDHQNDDVNHADLYLEVNVFRVNTASNWSTAIEGPTYVDKVTDDELEQNDTLLLARPIIAGAEYDVALNDAADYYRIDTSWAGDISVPASTAAPATSTTRGSASPFWTGTPIRSRPEAAAPRRTGHPPTATT